MRHKKGLSHLILLKVCAHNIPLTRLLTRRVRQLRKIALPINTVSVALCHSSLSGVDAHAPTHAGVPFSLASGMIILISSMVCDKQAVQTTLGTILSCKQPDAVQLTILMSQNRHRLPVRPSCINQILPATGSRTIGIFLRSASNQSKIRLLGPRWFNLTGLSNVSAHPLPHPHV